MNSPAAHASPVPRRSRRRTVEWIGSVFIAVIVALAGYDIWRSYQATVSNTGRELETQARVIAEQTARSLQAVDVALRHLAEQFQRGTLSALSAQDLRAYLKEQAIGLVQIDGLLVIHADGSLRASSYIDPAQEATVRLSGNPFNTARTNRQAGLQLGDAIRSTVDGRWIFPLMRRLESSSGEFAGAVAARGRIDYFQQFYQDIRLDPGTIVALLHQNGVLLARHPAAEAALGQRIPSFDQRLAEYKAGMSGPSRLVSPVDGAERFGVLQLVPDYPLAVIVTRDVAVALAPWRAQSFGTAMRTLTLSALAALLLVIVRRQFARLDKARESLEIFEERFTLAVAGSNDGIVDWDVVYDRMYSSERAMQILGVESDVTVRTRAEWSALVKYAPDDLPRMKEDLQRFLDGRTELRDGEYRVLQPDGSYRWIRHRNKCVRDAAGRPLRVAGSVSDIDAQKRAEAALRESELRYQLAVNGSNQGLWDWDLASDTLFLSARAQQFMGLAPSESLRPRREWIAQLTYHPDDLAAVRAAISAHLRGATEFFTVEYRLRHASGDWHWYRQRGVALRDARGRPYRMAGSMEDITDHKSAEAERAQLEGQLLQAKKLEAIGTLAGGIAHDFNNILAAILGYGEMAQKDTPEGTALRRHIDAVVGAGMRAKSLVERILAFSRSGIGERVAVHVQSVVTEALDLVAASLPNHVELDRRLAAGDAAVMGDPTQIHQVVMNLCANGAQAMKAKGTLTVSLDMVEKSGSMAATSALAGGRYVRLSVRDTGTGIPASVLERIFDPFFTTREVGVGTGLGLSLVHGIVTDLGGGIDVDSRPGEGTTFTVYLPWSDRVATQPGVEEAIPSGTGETILLVDDEEALVRLGEEMIAVLGYEPVGFTSSAAALASFRACPARFNAVLSDETMPEMTGSELAREIHGIRSDIPVVLMSGFVSSALVARARDSGVVDVLAKPLVSRDIARSLAGALRPAARP